MGKGYSSQPWLSALFIVSLLLSLSTRSQAQQQSADQSPWRDDYAAGRAAAGQLRSYRALTLEVAALRATLAAAPLESMRQAVGRSVLAIPLPNGTTTRFQLVEAPILAPVLAAQYPGIKTYAGIGLDDPTITLRCDLTPRGFHAQILSATAEPIYLDPVSATDQTHYLSYYRSQVRQTPGAAPCGDVDAVTPPALRAALLRRPRPVGSSGNRTTAAGNDSGSQLRGYRLAVGCTGEFTAYYGGSVGAMSAITTVINQVVGIQEKELALRLTLTATAIYTDAATDPYTNPDSHTQLLTDNQTALTNAIGSANYDVGHVFGVSNNAAGGLAVLNSACSASNKAQGSSGFKFLTLSQLATNVVAHELGHQFGATHTFNSAQTPSCGSPNRAAASAWEPGAGTTIMSYAAGCTDAVQYGADANYHTGSFEQIQNFIATLGTCATITATGNTAPTVTVPAGRKTLPVSTPFRLTAAGADAEGDVLTYSWEELDLGPAALLTDVQVPNSTVPLFRVRPPATSPTRFFPQLSSVLAGTTTMNGDKLPTVSRNLTFRCTVRDQHNGRAGIIGGVNYSDNVSLSVTGAAGPFVVTAPATAVNWPGTSVQAIAWDVAGTTANGVNCVAVNIRLSTDGGLSFPYLLAAGVANDGMESVTLPNVASNTARVQVEAADNYFFAISNANFTITATPGLAATGLSPGSGGSGTAVLISGAGFGTSAADLNVTFNGVAATISAVSNTSLTVTVPAAALTGQVVVTKTGTGAGSVSPGVFSVTPVITTLTPPGGPVGINVTMAGTSFGGATGVTFANGVTVPAASFLASDYTSVPNTITLRVPVGAVTGPVVVTTAGGSSAGVTFTVMPFAVAARVPARNALLAPAQGPVALTFTAPPSTTTAAGAPIAIFSSQRGGWRSGSGTFAAQGNTVSFMPDAGAAFRPGEVLTVATTAAASSSAGASIAVPETYRFTVAAGRATGALSPATNVTTGARPMNVALGDVNNDGNLDLITANSDNGNGMTVSVRLGDGLGTFGAGAADLAVGAYPQGLVLADVNNDGRLDILVACTNANAVYVLVRSGSGSGAGDFAPATTLAVGASPAGVVAADFNNDGWLDVAATNNYSSVARLHVFLNGQTTTGTFNAPTFFDLAGGSCYAVAAADLNNDGNLDLLVTNASSGYNSVSVALGNGQGAFAARGSVGVGTTPRGLAVGDLNEDGNLDLVTANAGSNNVSIRLGNGQGGFAAPATSEVTIGASQTPQQVVLADLNGDGHLDLVATNYFAIPGRLSLRLGTGNGAFTTPAVSEYNAGTQCYGLAVADLNSDGALDVAVSNFASTGVAGASVLLGVALPTVSRISPSTGPVGTAITIYGSGFVAGSTATIGGVTLTNPVITTNRTPHTIVGNIAPSTPSSVQAVIVTTGTNASNADVSFTVTAPLPVTLVKFDVVAQGAEALLRWTTASEWHSAYFEVETSLDGLTFGSLGTVAARGTRAAPYDYQWRDATLAQYQAATVYYRLRQVDTDGTSQYSPVRSVALATKSLALHPNPTTSKTTLTGVTPGAAVQVLDLLGRPVVAAVADSTGTAQLVLSPGLPTGVYLVQVDGQARRLLIK